MIVLGITGGIGSGKTTVVNFFKELGVPAFIADDEAKKLMHNSEDLKNQIITYFGSDAYTANKLNREFLAKSVFNHPEALQKLNSFVHPAVSKAFKVWKQQQNQPVILYEAAILFENNRQNECDYTILVTAPKRNRIKRIKERDGSSLEQIEARMKHQWNDSRKIKLADFVIKNEDLVKTKKKVHKIYKYLKNTHNF